MGWWALLSPVVGATRGWEMLNEGEKRCVEKLPIRSALEFALVNARWGKPYVNTDDKMSRREKKSGEKL
jgi:hypothetical protein